MDGVSPVALCLYLKADLRVMISFNTSVATLGGKFNNNKLSDNILPCLYTPCI